MCSVQNYATYDKFYVRTHVTHENMMFLVRMVLHMTMLYVRTYITDGNMMSVI